MRERRPNVQSFINKPSIAGLLLFLFLFLLLPAVPAQASEVVKLARLVITGHRTSVEVQALQQGRRIERLPPVLIEGRRSPDGTQLALLRRHQPRAL